MVHTVVHTARLLLVHIMVHRGLLHTYMRVVQIMVHRSVPAQALYQPMYQYLHRIAQNSVYNKLVTGVALYSLGMID